MIRFILIISCIIYTVLSCDNYYNNNNSNIFIDNIKINSLNINDNFHYSIDKFPLIISYEIKTNLLNLYNIFQYKYHLQIYKHDNMMNIYDSNEIISNSTYIICDNNDNYESDTSYIIKLYVWLCSNDIKPLYIEKSFRTGLLNNNDWIGDWIGHDQIYMNQFRKIFNIENIKNDIYVHIAGIGYHELYMNGQKVDETRQLEPGWTSYEDRVLYSSYNVTSYLLIGKNCLGVMLGNGWYSQEQYITPSVQEPKYGPPRFILQMGNILHSNSTFIGRSSEIIHDSVYNGEIYDAKRERIGWSKVDFQDSYSLWIPAIIMPSPGGNLVAQPMEPIRILSEIQPINSWNGNLNEKIFDFGQNLAGFTKITFKIPRGLSIRIKYAEVLEHPATGIFSDQVYQDNLRSAAATDVYISKGDTNGETYQPRFTYHGFRYVQIIGCPSQGIVSIKALQIGSDVKFIGNFSSNNEIINQIQHNIKWGQISNLMSVPSDCPQRDERKGWMGDASLSVDECMFNFDSGAFHSNFLNLILDSQTKDGQIADTTPFSFGSYPADPNWGSALPTITWTHYQHYGDISVIYNNYQACKNWLNFLTTQVEKTGLAKMYYHYGDWVPANGKATNQSLCSSSAYIDGLSQMIEMAKVLGNTNDIEYYEKLYNSSVLMFHNSFWNDDIQSYGDGGQTSNAMALYHNGIVPEKLISKVVNNLIQDIENNDYHLTSGILGVQVLFPVLSRYNLTSLALKILSQITYPSYGYMFNNEYENATTLWEIWNAPESGGGMNSRNHIMFGSVGSWFYRYLLGIQPHTSQTTIIQPYIDWKCIPYLSSANGYWKNIKISWDIKLPSLLSNNNLLMNIHLSIPPNEKIKLIWPQLSLNGKWLSLNDKTNNKLLSSTQSYIYSGEYHFQGIWQEEH